jgi:cell division protein FtsQ
MIIATGYITKWYAQRYISTLSKTIMYDDFWKNQIEQINILPDKGVELIPRVGNHIIYLGALPESNLKKERKKEIEDFVTHKLDRLKKFYKYGLSQAGWNKYSYINLEFDNQIICKKHNTENIQN